MTDLPDTLLELRPHGGGPSVGFAHWCARGLRHELTPLDDAITWRDPTGRLRSRARPGRRKYRLTVTCAGEVQPPDFGGLWRGAEFVVWPAVELSTAGGRPAERPAVPGSARVVTGADGVALTFYRPELVMAVTDWRGDLAEWEASRGWSLELTEV